MNKNIPILGAVLGIIIVGYAAFFYVPKPAENADNPAGGGNIEWAPDRTPTDFAHEGTLSAPPVTSGQAEMTFHYKDAEGREAAKTLFLDPLSICASSAGSVPCLAMSITFDKPFNGKRAIVEGVEVSDGVVLRKLRVLGEDEPALVPGPGSVFISWQEAKGLIAACEVKTAMQSHALDVYLTLRDDTSLRTVEPVIDEVFQAVNGATAKCGNIGLATE